MDHSLGQDVHSNNGRTSICLQILNPSRPLARRWSCWDNPKGSLGSEAQTDVFISSLYTNVGKTIEQLTEPYV